MKKYREVQNRTFKLKYYENIFVNKNMIDMIFNCCVDLLVKFAELLGLTYNEINVLIFIIIMPLISLIMLFTIIKQLISIKRLEMKIKISK